MIPEAAKNTVKSNTRHDDDFYATPAICTEVLLKRLMQLRFYHMGIYDIWEPACGDLAISKVFQNSGFIVKNSDIVDRCNSRDLRPRGRWFRWDFIGDNSDKPLGIVGAPLTRTAIITNPPFKHWLEFAIKSLSYTNEVCLFGMLNYMSGIKRFNQLFSVKPPQLIMVFTKRVEFSNGSNFYDFCWYVWSDELKQQNEGRTIIEWISPDQLDFNQYKLWSKA
jgi:hypothetical protein